MLSRNGFWSAPLFALTAGAQFQVELVKKPVQLVLRQFEMQRGGHLRGGIALGSGVGHRQSHGDTVRGEKQIARFVGNGLVAIDGAGSIAGGLGRLIGITDLGRCNALFFGADQISRS